MNLASRAPIFSIVIPAFNVESMIDRFRLCIDSVLAQSCNDWELIIVDDASTDNTAEILSRYAEADSRVRIHTHKENQRRAFARNSGTALARGVYLIYCDYDDYLFPDALATVNDLSHRYQYPDIIQYAHCSDCRRPVSASDLADRRAIPWWRRYPHQRMYTAEQGLSKFLRGHITHAPWVRATKVVLARQVLFNDLWVEDLPHSLETYAVAESVLITRERLYVHLLRPDSAGNLYAGKELFDSLAIAYECIKEISHQRNITTRCPLSYRYFCTRHLLQLVEVLASYKYTPADARRWQKLADPQALKPAWLLYHILAGLVRGRFIIRFKQLIAYLAFVRARRAS